MIYAVGRIYNGFMHATRYHYHHYADLLICIQHIWWKILWYKWILGIICQECLYDVMSSPSLGDRGDIFMTYLIIIIKPEVSIFPFVVIFSVAVCLRRLCHHMLSVSYISGKAGFYFFYYGAVLLTCAQMIEYIMTRWSYSCVYKLRYFIIIIMQTYLKALNY